MTIPKNVKDALDTADNDCGLSLICLNREDWQTIRAHLIIQDAEITNLRSAAQKAVLANVELRVRANLAESRPATANALLREIMEFGEDRGLHIRIQSPPCKELAMKLKTTMIDAADGTRFAESRDGADIDHDAAAAHALMQAMDEVPDLTDEMPDEMWEALRNDRDAMTEAFRMAVRETKAETMERADHLMRQWGFEQEKAE